MVIDFRALEQTLVFQKIINTRSKTHKKFEVLTRFTDQNTSKSVSPDFVFEEMMSASCLDIFTFNQLDKLRNMAFKDSGITHLSINIEPNQLSNTEIITELIRLQDDMGLDISVEITERAHSIMTKEQIDGALRLHSEGVFISLDDFGIGGSGLLRLLELPVSEVKLDRKIVSKLVFCEKTYSLVSDMTKMCNNLGINMVAEGVENIDTVKKLNRLNIHYHQGYYYGKAEPMVLDATINELHS